MITDFTIWFLTQNSLIKTIFYITIIVATIVSIYVNYKIKKQKELEKFKQFVYDYYNGTLNYRGEQQ